jgi:hypothetical protein
MIEIDHHVECIDLSADSAWLWRLRSRVPNAMPVDPNANAIDSFAESIRL